ncbi:MAG: leucyl aminopeptidase, partial [Sporichthyaceae bacterium]|nr:leucyl aminopeptidase [Sporichthyaceae bacterium]
MTTITLTSTTASAKSRADVLVIGATTGSDGPLLAAGAGDVDAALGGGLAAMLEALGATGKPEEITKIATSGSIKAPLVVAVGLGEAPAAGAAFDLEVLRSAAGAVTRTLSGTGSVALSLPAATPAEAVAVAEGALFGAYGFNRYRSNGAAKPPVKSITVHTPVARDKIVKDGVARAE